MTKSVRTFLKRFCIRAAGLTLLILTLEVAFGTIAGMHMSDFYTALVLEHGVSPLERRVEITQPSVFMHRDELLIALAALRGMEFITYRDGLIAHVELVAGERIFLHHAHGEHEVRTLSTLLNAPIANVVSPESPEYLEAYKHYTRIRATRL